jgi:two-component system copper resistance phosphate regulon response regulator CusR/two-component system response regulator QseB
MKTILCVEDEIRVLRNNKKTLTEAGINVLTAQNLAQARERLAGQLPDCIVLDIMLPDGNGLEYLKELRAQGNNIPVLMLTAWNTSTDIARGLDLGADDYIGKPFTYDVLLSRVKRMLSKSERVPERITRGTLSLDILSGQAFLNNVDMLLTRKEFSMLLLFTQNEGRMLSSEYLYEKAWGRQTNEDENVVRSQISRLRKKLPGSGYTITVEYGGGYCFERKF